ncbi:MAG: aminoglycoside 6-adenylyltransferase [Alphaproteobacteria bacterium]|nr:aminoglycoside 6-adenylyltransferase [Alphaproteobacteria bacterium]
MSSTRRDDVLASILRWAGAREDVAAVIQTGSLARGDGSADAFSDVDLEIIAHDTRLLAKDDRWLSAIADPIIVLHLEQDDGWPTRLAIYDNGMDGSVKVDFTLAAPRRLQEMISSRKLNALYMRGYRVLLDKDGVTKDLPPPSGDVPRRSLPAEEEFRRRVEEFWFEAFHIPKYLARGELFLVKQRDWTMKELLLEMMEWHALALSPAPVDVWHLGARLRQWTDPGTWRDLQRTFGHFDADDARRAFEETTTLYSRLAREVARKAGFPYPEAVEAKIRATFK